MDMRIDQLSSRESADPLLPFRPSARILEFGGGRQDLLGAVPLLLPEIARWVAEVQALVKRAGRRLPRWQLEDARQMGVREPGRVRVVHVEELPWPGHEGLRAALRRAGFLVTDARGLTLGHALLIRRQATGDRRVLRHRLRQVAQAEALGSAELFVATFLRQVAQFGPGLAPLALSESAREG